MENRERIFHLSRMRALPTIASKPLQDLHSGIFYLISKKKIIDLLEAKKSPCQDTGLGNRDRNMCKYFLLFPQKKTVPRENWDKLSVVTFQFLSDKIEQNINFAKVKCQMAFYGTRDHPFKTSTNFHNFWPLPTSVGSFLLLSVGKFGKF